MGSYNHVTVVGNLGQDPELRYTEGGNPVCNLSVATNEAWTDKAGEKQERTEWHRVVVWGEQAKACGEYLQKGRAVCVDGRLQTRKWQDKDGADRYSTEIVANRVVFLGGPGGEREDGEKSGGRGKGDDRGERSGGKVPDRGGRRSESRGQARD